MTARARTKQPKQPRAKTPKDPAGGAAAGAARRAAAAVGGGACWAGRGATWLGGGALSLCARALRNADVQRALALAAMAAGLTVTSGAVRQRVRSWSEHRIDTRALSAGPLPAGLSAQAREDIARLPLPQPASSFDHRLVPFTAALLADLQWVEEVEEVRLQPDGLSFSVRARRPVARLGTDPASPLLTADGAVIDGRYGADPSRLPRVTGIPGPQRLLARRRAVAAAIAVLDQVAGLDPPVEVVDVSGVSGRDPLASEVTLTLAGGLLVEWGRAGADGRASLPGESKRASLEEFLERGPDLATVERVALRWDETTYVLRPAEPLASAAVGR